MRETGNRKKERWRRAGEKELLRDQQLTEGRGVTLPLVVRKAQRTQQRGLKQVG